MPLIISKGMTSLQCQDRGNLSQLWQATKTDHTSARLSWISMHAFSVHPSDACREKQDSFAASVAQPCISWLNNS